MEKQGITIEAAIDFGKQVGPAVAVIVYLALAWNNLGNKTNDNTAAIASLTAAMNTQAAQSKKCADDLDDLKKRQAREEINQARLMYHFHIPSAEQPFSTCPPFCGDVSKRESLHRDPQAPVTGKMQGHALFDIPQAIATAPAPQLTDGADPTLPR